jgi:hypothetical protein
VPPINGLGVDDGWAAGWRRLASGPAATTDEPATTGADDDADQPLGEPRLGGLLQSFRDALGGQLLA